MNSGHYNMQRYEYNKQYQLINQKLSTIKTMLILFVIISVKYQRHRQPALSVPIFKRLCEQIRSQQEVTYFGQIGFLQDFYVSFGLKNTIQTYFFMGGEDNLNCNQILLNQGLQLVYRSQISNYDRTWALTNFTFDPNGKESSVSVSNLTATRSSGSPTVSGAFVKQALPVTQKSCFRHTFKKVSYSMIGLGIKSNLQ
ncbi:hypothetical protein pb186bvf_014988 [Paramecium bursaria]